MLRNILYESRLRYALFGRLTITNRSAGSFGNSFITTDTDVSVASFIDISTESSLSTITDIVTVTRSKLATASKRSIRR